MIKVELFNNLSDVNVLDKNLNNKNIVEGNFRASVEIQKPVIGLIGEYYNFNYCYIPILKRYYFIDKITMERKGFTIIHCSIDVLMTYKDDIRNSYALLSKATEYNPYYDGGYKYENRDNFRQLNFKNPFNEKGNIILVTSSIKNRQV